MVSEEREEERGPAPSPRGHYPHRTRTEPAQVPGRQRAGPQAPLGEQGQALAGYSAHPGLSPLPEPAQDLTADPPAHWGRSSSASGTDRAHDAKLLPAGALCTQSMAQRGTSHVVTGQDIPGTSKGFVVLIPKFQRPSEGPCFMWIEVEPG